MFEKVFRGCFSDGVLPERVVVALSGGVDSICLTYLLAQYKRHCNPHMQIMAITIDHRYRAGSSQEAHEVGTMVRRWGVDHMVKGLTYDGRELAKITNFEEVAREKRYEAFEQTCQEVGSRYLFVAHNLNDQLETYLQRLQQNSSIFGLIGLRQMGTLPTSPKCPLEKSQICVVRPLLSFEKSEIISTCEGNGIRWFEDHTNADIHLTKRNLFRYLLNEVIPLKLGDRGLLVEERDGIRLISKESLMCTQKEIHAIVSEMENKIRNLEVYLKRTGNFTLDERNLLLKLTIPFEILDTYNDIILSRFLYLNLYPLSSVKHYHWSYAKLERQAIPRILRLYKHAILTHTNASLNLTYLNVLFKVKVDLVKKLLSLSLSRQPLIQDLVSQICMHRILNNRWSNWLFFDRRYWLRLRLPSDDLRVTIIPYRHHDIACRKQLCSAFQNPNTLEFLREIDEGTPIIFAEHDSKSFAALPTFNIFSHNNIIDVEWCPKNNLYSL